MRHFGNRWECGVPLSSIYWHVVNRTPTWVSSRAMVFCVNPCLLYIQFEYFLSHGTFLVNAKSAVTFQVCPRCFGVKFCNIYSWFIFDSTRYLHLPSLMVGTFINHRQSAGTWYPLNAYWHNSGSNPRTSIGIQLVDIGSTTTISIRPRITRATVWTSYADLFLDHVMCVIKRSMMIIVSKTTIVRV